MQESTQGAHATLPFAARAACRLSFPRKVIHKPIFMKLQTLLRKIRLADQDFRLIEPGDKLALALSGGKDSMLLWLALSMYQKFKGKDFSLCAIHIDVGFSSKETELMKEFAEKYNLELHIVDTRIFDILNLPENLQGDRISCSLCSTLKKGTLIEEAKKLGCNKVVFGHHADDATETILLNLIHGGRFACFSPSQYMSRTDVTLIRPLVYATEEEIIKACRDNEIPAVKPVCPNDGHSQRQEMKELLNELYAHYPMAKENFQIALTNRKEDRLWQKVEDQK